MGTFFYGSAEGFDVSDDELAHLEAVFVAKLRRREPFTLTFATDEGREAVWVHEACNVRFSYDSARVELDRSRLDAMVKQTNRPSGLAIESGSSAVPAIEA